MCVISLKWGSRIVRPITFGGLKRTFIPTSVSTANIFNETSAIYYRSVGDPVRALQYAERSVAAFSGGELLPYYLSALKLKTEILAETGAWEVAYKNMKCIERAQDSLAANRFCHAIGRTAYPL